MAVCNLFNRFANASGNFMMFSQYVEDITRNYTESDNYKVVPTQFVALDIDYDNIDRSKVTPNDEELNIGIPKYFQNCFENACAYGRVHYPEWSANTATVRAKDWNPEISRNLFWNSMFDGEFLHTSKYGGTNIVDEVVYFENINMHSFNDHKGMGYGEIYCYIPTDGEKKRCQVVKITDSDPEGRKCDESNSSIFLEGYTDRYVENYDKKYYYNRDFSMTFDDSTVGTLLNSQDKSFSFNTIVVLYSVFKRINDDWKVEYSNIPLGMYVAGRFENDKLTNSVTKYVTTSYGTGTSYGLRICTRFSVNPNGAIIKSEDLIADDSSYINICQLMTAMNENLSNMMNVVKSAQNTSNQYKELLSIFKNNKTNVPYVKDINGKDYWFVNGRFVAAVGGDGYAGGCQQLAPETVQKRIDNLMDNNPDNDWSYIEDPNGCDCNPLSNWDLAEALGIEYDGPEFGGGSTGGDGSSGVDFEIAEDKDVADILNRENTQETE